MNESTIHLRAGKHPQMAQLETVSEEALTEMASAGSVRALRAVQSGDGRYALVAQIGMGERTLRSRRAGVRTWAKLDTLARFAREHIGINRFEVIGR